MKWSFVCTFRWHTDKQTHTVETATAESVCGRLECNNTLLLYLVPAGTAVSPLLQSPFLFHPSFVTVCQRTEKQLWALKGLIHLPLFHLWSVCFLFSSLLVTRNLPCIPPVAIFSPYSLVLWNSFFLSLLYPSFVPFHPLLNWSIEALVSSKHDKNTAHVHLPPERSRQCDLCHLGAQN